MGEQTTLSIYHPEEPLLFIMKFFTKNQLGPQLF